MRALFWCTHMQIYFNSFRWNSHASYAVLQKEHAHLYQMVPVRDAIALGSHANLQTLKITVLILEAYTSRKYCHQSLEWDGQTRWEPFYSDLLKEYTESSSQYIFWHTFDWVTHPPPLILILNSSQ